MNANAESELDTLRLLQTSIEVSHGSKNSQTSSYCSLGIVFVRLRIAKVHQESIPEQLGDMPIKALNDFRASTLVRTDDFSILFGIELGGEFGGIHEVAEHHGELAAFRIRRRSSRERCDPQGGLL